MKPIHDGSRPVLIPFALDLLLLSLPTAVTEPVIVSALSTDVKFVNALTLPLISKVQSPAGMMMPACAAEAAARIAPAAVFCYANHRRQMMISI